MASASVFTGGIRNDLTPRPVFQAALSLAAETPFLPKGVIDEIQNNNQISK